jgi:hypothetical protein
MLGGLLVAALLLLATGCGDEQIETTYGRRSGMFGKESVNGTAVLAGLFSRAGHRVRAKRVLSTTLMEKADVIVWAPDDFEPPSPDVIEWFDKWLSQGGRTLIYVGRDFDAAPGYYDKVIPAAPAKQVGELRSRHTEDSAAYNNARSVMQKTADCRWFQIDNNQRLKTVNSLEGPFSDGVDASGVEIELRSRLRPKIYRSSYGEDIAGMYEETTWDEAQMAEAEEDALWAEDEDLEADESPEEDNEPVALLEPQAAEVLLRSGEDILISKQAYDQQSDSHLVLVANGSFLLNLPLVNHQHRKLAVRLIDQFEPPQTVVFLESTAAGPPITDKEPSASIPTGLTLFAQRPLDVILFHVVALAIILCLARWPIFGRPAKPPRSEASDFGKHVEALGAMLRRTGNSDFATASLHHYQQQISDTQKVD